MFQTNKNGMFVELNKPYYYPGERVTGNVYVNIQQAWGTRGIDFQIKTKEFIRYIERVKKPFKRQRKNPQTKKMETYTAYEYVNVERRDEKTLYKFSNLLTQCNGNIFNIGQYCYPFEFTIPPNLPGSFEYYDKDSSACITYTVKAKAISINNAKEMIKSENVIIVRQPYTNFNYPTNVNRNIQLGCCTDKGTAMVNLQYDNNAYSLGETVNAHLVINNSSSKVPSTSSQVEIVQELCLQKPGTKGITKRRVILSDTKADDIPIGQTKEQIFNLRIFDQANPTLQYVNKCKHYYLFKEKNQIGRLQATCKGSLLWCKYYVKAVVNYEGCCTSTPTINTPILVYIPDDLNVNKFIRPTNFQPQVYNSISISNPQQFTPLPVVNKTYEGGISSNMMTAQQPQPQPVMYQQPQQGMYQQVPMNQSAMPMLNVNVDPNMNVQMNSNQMMNQQQQQPVTLNINSNVNRQDEGYPFNGGAPIDQGFSSEQMGKI